jgi:ubiquinone/menaquinone biosynthesis C-methylase UbiE
VVDPYRGAIISDLGGTNTMTVTETTTPISTTEADKALKAKHAAMWASGNYPAVADEIVGSLGARLVDATGVQAGLQVLDVASGTGTSAIPAAHRGAEVTATDLTPELLAIGEQQATAEGLQLNWRTADVEDLPFPNASFDTVLSCIGVMFAPHHQVAADELVRVCRPGGTIGVLSWTPDGFIGQMFATLKPYAPPPPPGASPAPLWGRADHVRTLFGNRVTDLVAHQQSLRVDRFTSGAEFRDFFKINYGPTIAVYRFIAGDPAKVAALDADLAALGDRYLVDGVQQWEYLLVTAKRT